jgi:NADPH:quinone reductase-like Zn-dependent oxidoreductase
MAKIVRFHKLGRPEVLKIEDVPSREPSKGEVVLSVQAIGLNRAESMFMHGYYLEPARLPATLGEDWHGAPDPEVPRNPWQRHDLSNSGCIS